MIGSTGSGKSSLLNTLCGKINEFKVSAKEESETLETSCKLLQFRESDVKVNFIDTPGLADSKGRDPKHISEIVDTLKSLKSVDAFLIVLNG